MDEPYQSPLPPRPAINEADSKPRGSWLMIGMVGMVGLALAVILTFLTIGYFGPVILLGVAIFGMIALQYLVWGWWFERIYRAEPGEKGERDA